MSASAHEVTDLPVFGAPLRSDVVRKLVDCVMRGTPFLALTGPSGAGKTAIARELGDELVDCGVFVWRIDAGGDGKIDLPSITRQILGVPGETPAEDVEGTVRCPDNAQRSRSEAGSSDR